MKHGSRSEYLDTKNDNVVSFPLSTRLRISWAREKKTFVSNAKNDFECTSLRKFLQSGRTNCILQQNGITNFIKNTLFKPFFWQNAFTSWIFGEREPRENYEE